MNAAIFITILNIEEWDFKFKYINTSTFHDCSYFITILNIEERGF